MEQHWMTVEVPPLAEKPLIRVHCHWCRSWVWRSCLAKWHTRGFTVIVGGKKPQAPKG